MRDLPDLALLATIREIESSLLIRAIAQTFSHRGTHVTPSALPDPPTSWAEVYRGMAAENALTWPDLDDVLRAARGFIDPVLDGRARARWTPSAWEWSP